MEMLSPHFSLDECKCPCCGLLNVSPTLLELAEKVRDVLKEPMIVHSVCRCKKHNSEVGGSPKSKHLTGQALDFCPLAMSVFTAYAKIITAYERGELPELGGIGLYDWGVHIDVHHASDGHLRRWDRRKGARA